MILRTNLLAAAVAVPGTIFAVIALDRLGFGVFALLAAAVLGVLLLDRVRVAVGLPLVVAVLVENDPYAGVSLGGVVYAKVPGLPITALEAMLLLAVGAVVLDVSRRGRLLTPRTFRGPLVLVALALVFGVVTGLAAGPVRPVVDQARVILPVIVVPLLLVNVVRSEHDLRRAIGLIAALTTLKAGIGVLAVAGNTGSQALAGESHLTYYEPTANFLSMLVLLGLVAAAFAGAHLGWRKAAGALVALSLLLSFRRSFWIGTVATLPVLMLVASGRTARRLFLPAVAVIAVAVYALIASGALGQSLDSPVGKRLTSLSPSQLVSNPEDRYRLDERKNVLATLGDHPVAGLGMARPWPARYPLSVEHEGGRNYVHFALLWWWLKMGVLGLIAYVAVIGMAARVGLRIWRDSADPAVRAAGLGTAGAFVGLAIAETTASFLGADIRMTVVAGACLGLLAAAERIARGEEQQDPVAGGDVPPPRALPRPSGAVAAH